MRTEWALVVGLAWSVGCGEATAPLPGTVESGDPEALEASREWVLANPTGWTVEVGCGGAFERGPSTPMECVNGTRSLQIDSGGAKLMLFFDCDVQPNLQSLRDTLDSAAISALPHGVELDRWRFYVFTPASRFNETLTVQTFADDAMTVEVVTPLFAISGSNSEQRCQTMDGISDGCWSRIEHQIPLTLRLCGMLPASLF